jgi:long-chain fatty acid transport protein
MIPTRWTAAARRAASAFIASLVTLSVSGAAQGAGLYFADRGVRPLGRGGAFIAGADDPGAIAYNPAGIFDAAGQILLDGSWVNFSSEYTRQAVVRQVDPNTGETTATYLKTFQPVEGTTPFLPIPTIGMAARVHPHWVMGGGIWVPYAALTTYPDGPVNGEPAPQRYSLLSLDGSALALIGVGAAYSPIPMVRVGATVGMLTGVFRSTVVFSGCVPERFFCAPEAPDWDVLAELNAGPIFAPTGQVGVTLIPLPMVRVGASFQLPIWVRSAATIRNRMPSAEVFANASQEGEDADLGFELPWSARLGVELRPSDNLRVEIAGTYDGWSMHDAIRVDPDGIALKNVTGFPEKYYIPSIALERGFKDSFSIHLGGEYGLSVASLGVTARAGVSYDSSAVPRERLSVLTIDGHKITPSVGVSVNVGPVRLDATYARVIMPEVTVPAEEARIQQVSPVQANPPANPTYINGGVYNAGANIIGLGAVFTFDPGAAAPPPAAP